MTTQRKRILISFTDDERAQVDSLAGQLRLSVSELLRRLALGHRLPDPQDFAAAQAIRDLLKINADQARLGNLLKLALDDDPGPAARARIDSLIGEIAHVQMAIKAGVHALHYDRHPRARRDAAE
jgi:hypothetical protein